MDQKIELRQVRDFGELVNDTFLFVKQNFKPFFQSIIYICGFFLIAYMITTVLQAIRTQDFIRTGEIKSAPFKAYGWEFVLNTVFSFIFHTSLGLTVYSYISLYREKGNIPPIVEEVWVQFKYFFWRMLGSFILLGLLTVIGLVFCIFPGIYLWPVTSVISAIMVFENGTLGYAFDRGFKLIKGNWWTTFGAMFIIAMVAVAVSLIIVLPISLFSAGSLLLHKTAMSVPLTIFSAVLSSITQVFWILPYVVVSLCYFSLVERKEGVGLEDKLIR